MIERHVRAIPLVILLAAGPPASAADADGRFAVRGAGMVPCKVFLEQRRDRTAAYRFLAGWIEGFLSAYNQHVERTFDIAPWQSNEVMAGAVAATCEKTPDRPFFTALWAQVAALREGRLERESPTVAATNAGRTVRVYRATLERIQEALAARGHYRGKVDGQYGPGTRDALLAFQRGAGIPTSGLPDPVTRLALMRPAPG